MKNKRVVYRISNGIIVVAVIAILVIFNIFVRDASWKIDLTQAGMYKLSQQTIDYISTLEDKTTLKILEKDGNSDDYIIKIAKLYPKYSDNIEVEMIDPDANPGLIAKYLKKDSTLMYGSIVIDNGKNWDVVNSYGTVVKNSEGSIVSKVERKITSAIYKINSEQKNTIYLLTGHGERTLAEIYQIKEDLGDISYTVNELNLFEEGKIPEDIYSLAILGPTMDISDRECEIILEYIKNGGNLTIAIDVDAKGESYNNIKKLAKEYNLSIDDNYICESDGHYVQDQVMALIPKLSSNEITNELIASKVNIFMPLVRSISVLDEDNKDVKISPFLVTTEKAWSRTDLNNPVKDVNDKVGVFNLAVSAVKTIDEKESKLVIFGSSNIIDYRIIEKYSTGNKDLFISSLKWFKDDSFNMVDVPEKVVRQDHYKIDGKTAKNLILAAMMVPLFFATIGAVVYVARRD